MDVTHKGFSELWKSAGLRVLGLNSNDILTGNF